MRDLVLIADPQVAAIAVDDCGEPLVAVEGVVVSGLKAELGPARLLVRSGVAARLDDAAARLPEGIHLCFVEGWRDPAMQRYYFDEYRQTLLQHAGLCTDAAELDRLASRYIAPPALAPHPAGAAVDLTLCRADGTELDLGTPVNASPEDSDFGCYTAAPQLTARARANRTLLVEVMTAAGFVNYPTEWWHWSYGDRYWALHTGAAVAIYGTTAGA